MSAAAVVLLGLTLLVAAGDCLALRRGDLVLGSFCKPVAALFLVALAVELHSSNANATAWVVLALVLSAVGDLLLWLDREHLFVAALAVFVGVHLAYVAAMLTLGVDGRRLLLGVVLAAAVAAAVGRKVLAAVTESKPELLTEIQTYIGATAAVVALAMGVGRPAGIVGAWLYSAADALGGWNRFVQPHPLLPLAGAVAYHLGQIGLVLMLA